MDGTIAGPPNAVTPSFKKDRKRCIKEGFINLCEGDLTAAKLALLFNRLLDIIAKLRRLAAEGDYRAFHFDFVPGLEFHILGEIILLREQLAPDTPRAASPPRRRYLTVGDQYPRGHDCR